MELNFTSVETIPNLNASAAFQVDSGKVFKEDVDMVPTIIDNALPSYFLGVCQDFKQLHNLLTLGSAQTSLALRSLNRRFRLLCLGDHTERRGLQDWIIC